MLGSRVNLTKMNPYYHIRPKVNLHSWHPMNQHSPTLACSPGWPPLLEKLGFGGTGMYSQLHGRLRLESHKFKSCMAYQVSSRPAASQNKKVNRGLKT